jgi:regulator of protease activity HflC (stomatin/prohibitin superfamily)
MALFIAAIIFLLFALGALGVRRVANQNVKSFKGIEKLTVHQQNDLDNDELNKTISTIVGGIFLSLFLIFFAWSCIKIVPANNVGIPVAFGQIGSPLDSGFHIEKPWTKVHNFSTRLQESSMLSSGEGEQGKQDSISVRGNDGYEMWVDVTIRYTIDEAIADQLFRRVGSMDGIRDRIVRPEVRESVRIVFARFTSEDGYSTKREVIARDVNTLLKERLNVYGVNLDSAVIRSVDPDQTLKNAISQRAAAREKSLQAEIEQDRQVTESETRKQVAERDATALTTKAQGEADAKRIAAQGEADSNKKVSESLTPEILRQLQIEALKNGTVYVVPDGGNFVLGNLGK